MSIALLSAASWHATGSLAQTTPAYNRTYTPVSMLLTRAARLNEKGRADLAAQAWRQVLFADPENATALQGLIRFYAKSGDEAAARSSLLQLRAAHPRYQEIENLERAIASGPAPPREQPEFPPTQDARLLRAEKASQQGDSSEAFHLYRSVFGANPPRQWAIAYFQEEAAVPGRKITAAKGLGQMAQQYPNDVPLTVAWGRMLTLDPATRLRGTQILARYASSDPRADEALHRSLLWGVDSPGMAAEIAAYLAQHSDPALSVAFGRARSVHRYQAEISAAYRALQKKDIPLAEQKFREILTGHPNDRGALAGMGYASLERRDFSAAVHWLQLAERDGDHSSGLHRALATARFWQCMAGSQSALLAHHPQQAEAQLHRALDLEPDNPTARLALAHFFAETGRQADALPIYRGLAKRSADPAATSSRAGNSAENAADAWSGWLASVTALRDPSAPLSIYEHLPAAMQAQLSGSPTFLTALAQAYLADHRPRSAERALSHAAQLKVPALRPQQQTRILLQYAALCVRDGNYRDAITAYREIARSSANDPTSDASAWQGLVLIEHLQDRDASGLRIWNRMPPAVRKLAMRDTSFLLLVAAMQQSQKDFSSATWLYRGVLAHDPNNIAAWTELLRTLHQTGEDRQSRDTEATMPPAVREQLRSNPAYFQPYTLTYYQTMAGVEQALGNPQAALAWLQRMNAIARSHNADVPVDMQLQEAWLLYDLQQDDAAQACLLRLRKPIAVGGSKAPDQQNQIMELTANLAVRKAERLTKLGKRGRALQVLDRASSAVGGQTAPRLRLAAGYLSAGAPATALAMYRSAGLQQATFGDRKAAIGAAMESKQPRLAQTWLQQALSDSPHDPGLLLLAANFAQSHGDEPLALSYLNAALAHPSTPSDHSADLAHSADHHQTEEIARIHREAAELLASIQASHSGWLGGTGYVSHIIGTSGTTQLTDVEVPLELSLPVGHRVRFTTILRAASLSSGRFQGDPGQSLGTLIPGAAATSGGVAGGAASVQIATPSLAASLGFTPAGFPVVNLTAAASLHKLRSPWTVGFSRDSVRESQLSYAGLHDPANPAHVWGGAVANLGTVQYSRGNSTSGGYTNLSGGVITGNHVASNMQLTGDAGAYWQVWSRGPSPADESLKLGINVYVQHDEHNELLFTSGHGGYFSPFYYLLPAIPLTYAAQPSQRLRYELSGSLGPQILSQSSARYFPLDPTLQALRGNPVSPAQFSVGVNYGVQGKISYMEGQNWLLTAFFSANNASSYNQQIGGLSLRYLFRDQRVSRRHTAGWFPLAGLRPYDVP